MTKNAPNHQPLMRRAIDLAMRGRGSVEPNPMVGCVIVKDDRVIGDGYHQKYGHAHAEPNALASCTESPAEATAYVTLEPCCHKEKQTPPCVPRLIEAKIARVVLGCTDPNPRVNGRGIAELRNAGIEVITGVMEDECRQLIAPFIVATQYRRPYITLKWAESADGKIAGPGGQAAQISNETSRRAVHNLRGRCDCVVVGIGTVLADDPMLTVREAQPLRPLCRYVLDRKLRTPLQSRLVQTARQIPVIIATDESMASSRQADELKQRGVEIVTAENLSAVASDWYRRKFSHVLVEAGPTLANAMVAENLADRIWIIRSRKIIAETSAPSAATLPNYFQLAGRMDLGGDQLTEYLNPRSPVFFAPVKSADFEFPISNL